jgi:thiol-disulfide isomerase/thioredoxin
MIKRIILGGLIAWLALGTVSRSMAQGIEFFHGTWEEALLKARQEDKIIFVDAYTTWCGPCKRMSSQTFPDAAVGEYFNPRFVSLKIDMEKGPGLEFRKKYPVSAYPTLFFIDPDEKVVQKSVGAKDPAGLISLAESVMAGYDKSAKYASAYEAGDRSYELVYNYVAALNKSGKPTNKIANEYIATQADLNTPDNLRFLLEAATQVDCQCFEYFETYKAQIIALTSGETVDNQIRNACANTVKRAIEFESPELIAQAGQAMKRHLPKEADFFISQSNIQYALQLHQLDGIVDKVEQHVRRFIKGDPALLEQMALDLEKYAADDPGAMALAVDTAGKAAKPGETKYVLTYARLTQKVIGADPAVKILDDALLRIEDQSSKDYIDLSAMRSKFLRS